MSQWLENRVDDEGGIEIARLELRPRHILIVVFVFVAVVLGQSYLRHYQATKAESEARDTVRMYLVNRAAQLHMGDMQQIQEGGVSTARIEELARQTTHDVDVGITSLSLRTDLLGGVIAKAEYTVGGNPPTGMMKRGPCFKLGYSFLQQVQLNRTIPQSF